VFDSLGRPGRKAVVDVVTVAIFFLSVSEILSKSSLNKKQPLICCVLVQGGKGSLQVNPQHSIFSLTYSVYSRGSLWRCTRRSNSAAIAPFVICLPSFVRPAKLAPAIPDKKRVCLKLAPPWTTVHLCRKRGFCSTSLAYCVPTSFCKTFGTWSFYYLLLLQTVYQALLNETPVVVVGGSGQWSNILASLYISPPSTIDESVIQELLEGASLFVKSFDTIARQNFAVRWNWRNSVLNGQMKMHHDETRPRTYIAQFLCKYQISKWTAPTHRTSRPGQRKQSNAWRGSTCSQCFTWTLVALRTTLMSPYFSLSFKVILVL